MDAKSVDQDQNLVCKNCSHPKMMHVVVMTDDHYTEYACCKMDCGCMSFKKPSKKLSK